MVIWFMCAVTLAIFIYLVYALLYPEKF
ncbi:K(+)-transporting ATPase subunit F [Croceifilum oryzae]